MKKFQTTRGSLLLATLTLAHSHALNELIARNGEYMNDDEIKDIAELRGIDQQSFIHQTFIQTQSKYLDEKFQSFLTKKFVEQWIRTFSTAQQSLIDLTTL